jgi:hypothetical protein
MVVSLASQPLLGFALTLHELQGDQVSGGISRSDIGIELIWVDFGKSGIDPASATTLHVSKRQELLHQILDVALKTAMPQFEPGTGFKVPERLFGSIPNHGVKEASNVVTEVIQMVEMLAGKWKGGLKTDVQCGRKSA